MVVNPAAGVIFCFLVGGGVTRAIFLLVGPSDLVRDWLLLVDDDTLVELEELVFRSGEVLLDLSTEWLGGGIRGLIRPLYAHLMACLSSSFGLMAV